MKTYCLVCKNYTDNSNSRVVKKTKINVKIKLFGVWKYKKYVYFKGIWFT